MSSITAASPLTNLHGTIALAGAGKMGGAMLTGWLAGGLDGKRVVVIEPQPSSEIDALAAKGKAPMAPVPRGSAADGPPRYHDELIHGWMPPEARVSPADPAG